MFYGNNTGWCKSQFTEEKIEYLHYDSSKWADFFINDRGMHKLYIHKGMPRETLLLSTIIDFNKKMLLFYR
jgi:hypothetical protein